MSAESATLNYLKDRIIEAGNRIGMYQYDQNIKKAPHSDWGPPEMSMEFARTRLIDRLIRKVEEELMEELKPKQQPKKKSFFRRIHESRKR